MPRLNKSLAAAAAISLTAALGAAWAQTASTDPNATVTILANTAKSGNPEILYFKDQGNSPETDPAAHLLLIKENQPAPVAMAESSTVVADAAPVYTAPAQSSTDTSSSTTTTTDTTTDNSTTDNSAAMPAPRADRN